MKFFFFFSFVANLTQLILENFQAGLILDQVHLEFRTEREKFQNAFEKKLIKDHAVRSRISQWKSDRIQEAMQKYDEEIKWKLENSKIWLNTIFSTCLFFFFFFSFL